ncbi:unnamed protein product [Haemonchus placei]|uniref:ThiF domain-containing protein n=1 Tax=Haemonchus placei TaxID=6290 RepID=A0A158QLD5_HAEPC|nr:unnamed protein product [Haemonchus placei]
MRLSSGASGDSTLNHAGDSEVQLSKAEAEVYDRQIRLWGLEAQQNAFICGLSGVGAEIAKNLMLCGLRSLTLMDKEVVKRDDIDSNFLLGVGSVGLNVCFYDASSIVVRLRTGVCLIYSMRGNGDSLIFSFIACSVYGWVGYSFFDFNNHLFLRWMFHYPSFADAFNVDWSKKQLVRKSRRLIPCSYFPLKAMLRAQKESKLTGDEVNDVSALSKLWSEEVSVMNLLITCSLRPPLFRTFHFFFLQALSEKERPLQNVFIYSALDTTGIVCHFPPPH